MRSAKAVVSLFGEYHHKVDAKGRLALPSKFRKALPEKLDELVVTLDPDGGESLMVFTSEDYATWLESLFESLGGYDPLSRNHRLLRSKLSSQAKTTEIDSSGRINVPADLRERAGITRDVTVIGNAGYFELWDAKRWESKCTEVDLSSMFRD